jgi:hypothetical protein
LEASDLIREEVALAKKAISNLGKNLFKKSNAIISQTKLFDLIVVEQDFCDDQNSEQHLLLHWK